MNTQLKERPATHTPTTAPEVRPQPVWTEPAEAGPSAPPVRRPGRWIALVGAGLVAGSAVALVATATGDDSSPDPVPTERPAFDSPGGNSMNIRPRVQAPSGAPSGFDSPGGNSMNIRPPVEAPVTERPAFDSPGGNSMNIRPRVQAPTRPAFDSPGGNSMNIRP